MWDTGLIYATGHGMELFSGGYVIHLCYGTPKIRIRVKHRYVNSSSDVLLLFKCITKYILQSIPPERGICQAIKTTPHMPFKRIVLLLRAAISRLSCLLESRASAGFY